MSLDSLADAYCIWSVLQINVWFWLSQNEEEVLFMGRMYEPKRGEGKEIGALGR